MNKVLRQTQMFFKRNSSTILTCIGGAGVVVTAVMAVKATPKAMTRLEEVKLEKGEELTKMEIVKTAGPAYIPAILVGVSTIACIFGANALNKHKQASIMSAYALLDSSYKEYRDKVQDLYGKEVDEKVKNEVVKDKYEKMDIPEEDDKELFFDDFSGRYFRSTIEKVKQAEYDINRTITVSGSACLNEFYDAIGIPTIEGGDELGWSIGGLEYATWTNWLDFMHSKVEMDDGMECTIIRMSYEPLIDYDYY